MMSTQKMCKDTVTLDGQKIDVRYHFQKQTPHDHDPQIIFDKITHAGTERHFDVDMSRWDDLKDKLSGRF